MYSQENNIMPEISLSFICEIAKVNKHMIILRDILLPPTTPKYYVIQDKNEEYKIKCDNIIIKSKYINRLNNYVEYLKTIENNILTTQEQIIINDYLENNMILCKDFYERDINGIIKPSFKNIVIVTKLLKDELIYSVEKKYDIGYIISRLYNIACRDLVYIRGVIVFKITHEKNNIIISKLNKLYDDYKKLNFNIFFDKLYTPELNSFGKTIKFDENNKLLYSFIELEINEEGNVDYSDFTFF